MFLFKRKNKELVPTTPYTSTTPSLAELEDLFRNPEADQPKAHQLPKQKEG